RSAAFQMGIWGIAAVIAVSLVVLASRTELGTKRVYAAYQAITSQPGDPPPVVLTQLMVRTADVERESRRLNDTLRSLTTERERITSRLGMVEREMGDLTGSITRSLANQKTVEAKPATTPAVQTPPP